MQNYYTIFLIMLNSQKRRKKYNQMKHTVNRKDRPVYLQIYRQFRDDIIGGIYAYGEKLPSKRLLSEELGVSTVTVEHAYALLCDEGYAEAREREADIPFFSVRRTGSPRRERARRSGFTRARVLMRGRSFPFRS